MAKDENPIKKKGFWALFLMILTAPLYRNPASPPNTGFTTSAGVEEHIHYVQKSSEFTGDNSGKSIVAEDEQSTTLQENLSTEQQFATPQDECTATVDHIRDEINSILSNPIKLIAFIAEAKEVAELGYYVIKFVLEKYKKKVDERHSKLSLPPNPFFDQYYQRAISVLEFYKEFKNEPKLSTAVLSARTGIPEDELEIVLLHLGFTKSGNDWTPPRPTDDMLQKAMELYRKWQYEQFLRSITLANIFKIALIAFEIWLIYRTVQNAGTITERIGNSILPVIILIVTIYFVFFVFRNRRATPRKPL